MRMNDDDDDDCIIVESDAELIEIPDSPPPAGANEKGKDGDGGTSDDSDYEPPRKKRTNKTLYTIFDINFRDRICYEVIGEKLRSGLLALLSEGLPEGAIEVSVMNPNEEEITICAFSRINPEKCFKRKLNEMQEQNQNRPTCFNCDSFEHLLPKCDQPLDKERVEAKQQELALKLENRYKHLKPGIVSAHVREALGLQRGEMPYYFYRMRTLGYPLGWLNEASSVPIDECKKDDVVKFDTSKIHTFPAFNKDPGSYFVDDHYSHGVRKMKRTDLKEHFIRKLENINAGIKNNVEDVQDDFDFRAPAARNRNHMQRKNDVQMRNAGINKGTASKRSNADYDPSTVFQVFDAPPACMEEQPAAQKIIAEKPMETNADYDDANNVFQVFDSENNKSKQNAQVTSSNATNVFKSTQQKSAWHSKSKQDNATSSSTRNNRDAFQSFDSNAGSSMQNRNSRNQSRTNWTSGHNRSNNNQNNSSKSSAWNTLQQSSVDQGEVFQVFDNKNAPEHIQQSRSNSNWATNTNARKGDGNSASNRNTGKNQTQNADYDPEKVFQVFDSNNIPTSTANLPQNKNKSNWATRQNKPQDINQKAVSKNTWGSKESNDYDASQVFEVFESTTTADAKQGNSKSNWANPFNTSPSSARNIQKNQTKSTEQGFQVFDSPPAAAASAAGRSQQQNRSSKSNWCTRPAGASKNNSASAQVFDITSTGTKNNQSAKEDHDPTQVFQVFDSNSNTSASSNTAARKPQSNWATLANKRNANNSNQKEANKSWDAKPQTDYDASQVFQVFDSTPAAAQNMQATTNCSSSNSRNNRRGQTNNNNSNWTSRRANWASKPIDAEASSKKTQPTKQTQSVDYDPSTVFKVFD